MKIDKDLILSGHSIKGVADAKDPGDAINKAFFDKRIASWEHIRYYYVDAVNGNDNNIGYTDWDIALDESKYAIKSVEKLQQIIPRIGSGASIWILINPGSYGNLNLSLMDYEEVQIIGCGPSNIIGTYNTKQVFYNDLKAIRLLNIDGSNPNITNINADKCRVRFSHDTITTKLRGFNSDIDFTDSNLFTIRLIKDPIIPFGVEDILYIEEPNVKINKFDVNVWTFKKVLIGGITGTRGFRCNSPLNQPDITFCYGPAIL